MNASIFVSELRGILESLEPAARALLAAEGSLQEQIAANPIMEHHDALGRRDEGRAFLAAIAIGVVLRIRRFLRDLGEPVAEAPSSRPIETFDEGVWPGVAAAARAILDDLAAERAAPPAPGSGPRLLAEEQPRPAVPTLLETLGTLRELHDRIVRHYFHDDVTDRQQRDLHLAVAGVRFACGRLEAVAVEDGAS